MEGEGQTVILNKRYRLLEKIGSGSFGSIYMCTHEQTQVKTTTTTNITLLKL
jgi:serine/threonine protein kinase